MLVETLISRKQAGKHYGSIEYCIRESLEITGKELAALGELLLQPAKK